MNRITISLPETTAVALQREARRRRVPVSQIAREAIEDRLGLTDAEERNFPFIGLGASGYSNTSEDVDEILAASLTIDSDR